MYNVIGDIAGNYKTFLALIEKMPKVKIISVGDIIDRGPSSDKVIEYFITNKDTTEVLMGNHEHMMIDFYRNVCNHSHKKEYGTRIWQNNGGGYTAQSFNNQTPSEEILSFLETRKISLEFDLDGKSFYISHAFNPPGRSIDEDYDERGRSDTFRHIWSRRDPFFNSESADVQICGHNSQWSLRYFKSTYDEKIAISIDTSRESILTGIHLPTMEIFQQSYID